MSDKATAPGLFWAHFEGGGDPAGSRHATRLEADATTYQNHCQNNDNE
jgi:hypothetical protein